MPESSTDSRGMGALSTLLLVFVVLKLTNLIDWSWWWVLSPLWMPFVVLGAGFIMVALWMLGSELVSKVFK